MARALGRFEHVLTGYCGTIDPTHDRFTDLRYITTATGRDYRDVAPTSGTYASLGARGTLSVRRTIRIASLDGI